VIVNGLADGQPGAKVDPKEEPIAADAVKALDIAVDPKGGAVPASGPHSFRLRLSLRPEVFQMIARFFHRPAGLRGGALDRDDHRGCALRCSTCPFPSIRKSRRPP